MDRVSDQRKATIGVLCIQGAFIEHVQKLNEVAEQLKDSVSLEIEDVRRPDQLAKIDALIIPGGESTTMSLFLSKDGFEDRLREWLKGDVLAWGTCAGLILLSDELLGQKKGGQIIVGLLDEWSQCLRAGVTNRCL